MKLFVIALIVFGALSAESAAGYLWTGVEEEFAEEFAEPPLPALQQVRPAVDCTPAQDKENPSDDLFSNKEEPLRLAALPVLLTGIAAAGLLSGCEVNVGPGGRRYGASTGSGPNLSPKEREKIYEEAKELYPNDKGRQCEYELRKTEYMHPRERESICYD